MNSGLRGQGSDHTAGNPRGNGTGAAIARTIGGNGGADRGLPRPPDTARAAARSSSVRAPVSSAPNTSTATIWFSRPGRAQSATRTASSFRCCPSGSAAQAARHSAAP